MEAQPSCLLCGGRDARFRFEKHGRRFLRCASCGLVWIDPMPTPEALHAYYDEHYRSGRYEGFAAAGEIRRRISEHRLAKLRGRVRPGRWLDVGCSSGDFVAAAAAAGFEAEGLDISPAAIESLRARGLVGHCARVEDFEPTKAYDTITAFDVIEHLLDPRAFLRHVRDWLVEEGSLVLTLPDEASLYARVLMRKHWFYYWPDEHLFYFDPRNIQRLLRETGFIVESVGPAYKPLTVRYAARNLESFNSTLGALARRLVDALPASLASLAFDFYVGEMMVLARRAPGDASRRAS